MKFFSLFRYSHILVIIASAGVIITFQNCSQTGFNASQTRTSCFNEPASSQKTSMLNIQNKANSIRSGLSIKRENSKSSLHTNSTDMSDNEIAWSQAGLIRPNTYIRGNQLAVGVSEPYGGTIFEILDRNGRNKIDVHGGSAMQLSIWGYDQESALRDVFPGGPINAPKRNPVKGRSPISENACGSQALMPEGSSLAGLIPWNPIMAQDINCSWNSYGANKVDSAQVTPLSISIQKTSPKFFNISSSAEGQFKSNVGAEGLTWWQTVEIPDKNSPYVKITYRMKYDNPEAGIGPHNQEIPALFNRFKNGSISYFYDQNKPYADANSTVSSITTSKTGTFLVLPNRQFTAGAEARLHKATEAWQSVCRAGPGEDANDCLTIATFSPLAQAFTQEHMYNTVLGNFALNKFFDETWVIYIFPYKYNEVINGLTVRQHIYALAKQSGIQVPPTNLPQVCSPNTNVVCTVANGQGQKICNAEGSSYGTCVTTSCNDGYELRGGQCVCTTCNSDETLRTRQCAVSPASNEFAETQTVTVQAGGVPGQNGTWWCENHFGKNLGGTWVCLDENCSNDAITGQVIKCGRR